METLARLAKTQTFRDGGLDRWRNARLGVIGCGNLGSRFAIEAVRSGAAVWVCDPDVGEPANLGTQPVCDGRPKVQSVVEACEAIRSGSARGHVTDVRHLGIGALNRCDLLADCTDDPRLAPLLTEIGNGLRIPLLRLALDGSGRRELGRVLFSDGGNGGACQVCNYSSDDLWRQLEPAACPGQTAAGPPPTLAGGALGMMVAGLGLLQAQRAVTGNDLQYVRNREVIADWSSMQVYSVELRRSDRCLSGHQQWELAEIAGEAVSRLADLLDVAATRQRTSDISVECYGHSLCLEASCPCGQRQLAVGTRWAAPPSCSKCGGMMRWEDAMQLTRVNRHQAETLGIAGKKLGELGFPKVGPMFLAHARGNPPIRFLVT